MARVVTLPVLLSRVRQRADVETALHVTDVEVYSYINESVAALHSLIVEAGEDDFLSSFEVSTVAGQEAYDITAEAANFYKLESVDALIDGLWAPLDRWQFSERHVYENASADGWGSRFMRRAYRITGRDTLRLLPVPDGVYTVRIWFHEASRLLPYEGEVPPGFDEYDGRDGWEEWVVLDAAIKIGVKEETDVRALIGEREKVERRVLPQARSKDRARPARVVDVDRVRTTPWGDV